MLHDFLYQHGGAELVFKALSELEVSSQSSVIGGSRSAIRALMGERSVGRLAPFLISNRAARMSVPLLASVLPRMEPITSHLMLSTYAVARWVRASEPRLIYCHSPMRQIWHGFDYYGRGGSLEAVALRRTRAWLQSVDRRATEISDWVAVPSTRVASLYRRVYGSSPQSVVPPPVRPAFFGAQLARAPEGYFVWVGRIVEPVKRLRWLLEYFAEHRGDRLVIVGSGRSEAELKREATSNVWFVGELGVRDLIQVVGSSLALLLPSMEDFGLSAAEALALGVPVVATSEAGVSDIIISGKNGIIAPSGSGGFGEALSKFTRRGLASPGDIRRTAEGLRSENFKESIRRGQRALGWL